MHKVHFATVATSRVAIKWLDFVSQQSHLHVAAFMQIGSSCHPELPNVMIFPSNFLHLSSFANRKHCETYTDEFRQEY